MKFDGFLSGSFHFCKESGKQCTAIATRAKIDKPLPKQELINRLLRKHPQSPLTQISSVATHRSDANRSTVNRDRAPFLFVALASQDHAILRNLPYEQQGLSAHHEPF